METTLKNVKTTWYGFMQIGIWVVALGGTFLLTPPLLSASENSVVQPLTRFIIAALTGLAIIPIKKRSGRTDVKFWYRSAIVLFFLCLITVFTYTLLLNVWGARYYGDVLIKGKTMTPEAVKEKEKVAQELVRPSIDDDTFIKARGGETQYIYPIGELKQRYYIITAIYILCVAFVLFFILSITQSIYCYNKTI